MNSLQCLHIDSAFHVNVTGSTPLRLASPIGAKTEPMSISHAHSLPTFALMLLDQLEDYLEAMTVILEELTVRREVPAIIITTAAAMS